jgi:hypothetical protein
MTCTECGREFAPACADEEICPSCQCEDLPEAHMVFTNCNVCGIRLRTQDEDVMGMCEGCAGE